MDLAETQSDLARALGVDKGYVSRLSKREWFPGRGEDGWDVAKVRRAIEGHVNVRKSSLTGKGQARRKKRAGRPGRPGQRDQVNRQGSGKCELPERVAAALRVLEEGDEPAELAKAAVVIAANALAESRREGQATPKAIDGLKRTLEELRRTAAGWIELEERRGSLIRRDIAKLAMSDVCQRLVDAANRWAAELSTQIEVWVGNEEFLAGTSASRSQLVGDWARKSTRSLLAGSQAELESLIEGQD